MLVRRYVVKDMPEAVVLIRKDLGKDAVILSSKRIRLKRWLGLWHTKRIEVLAATGDDVPKRVPRTESGETLLQTAKLDGPKVENEDGIATTSTTVSTATPASWLDMQRELSEMRSLLQKAVDTRERPAPPRVVASLEEGDTKLQRLMEQGVPQEVAVSLLAAEGTDEVDAILSVLKDVNAAQPIHPQSRVCAFVGPTGVGKTTTVAKVAALHVLAGTRKVGLVTTDTYRIAAVEQLKTYARILHVPLEVVQSPDDFPAALERLADCNLVLIDTAGRSYRTQEHIEEVSHLLGGTKVDETFLVMSLTSKPQDLQVLAQSFFQMKIDKFLFTKMDETESYGSILALLHQYQKPISYITTGQNVPDDIEIPSLEKLVRLILEGVA